MINATSSDPFVQGTRLVSFTGTSPQTLSTALAGGETFYALLVDNNSPIRPQVSFGSVVTVTSRFDLDNGVVDLNDQMFTLGQAGAASRLERNGGWLYNGTFRRYWPNNVRVLPTTSGGNTAWYGLFPLGDIDDLSYRPIAVTATANTTAAGYFTARHIPADGVTDLTPPGYNEGGGVFIRRKHNAQFLTAYSGVTVAGSTRFTLTATMTGLLPGVAGDIRLAISNAPNTVTLAGNHLGAASATNPTVGRSNLLLADLNNRDWRIATTNITNTPLPVELASFSARLSNDIVNVHWRTASELNNHFFTLERTADLEHFEPIFETDGAGTTNEPRDYGHTDTTPLYGRSYYRLKQTDFDGKYSYSKVVTVDYAGPRVATLHVFPNPSDGHSLNVLVKGLRERSTLPLEIVDIRGRVVYQTTFEIDTPGVFRQEILFPAPLPPGLYLVRSGGTLRLVEKLLIK